MDVLLSLLPTNTTIQGPGAAVSAGDSNESVPPALAKLPPGTLLEGFVLNRDKSGNPILRTTAGDFLLQSKFFLKIGSDVVIRIDATGKNFKASIITVDGRPAASAESIPAHATDDDIITRSDDPRAAALRRDGPANAAANAQQAAAVRISTPQAQAQSAAQQPQTATQQAVTQTAATIQQPATARPAPPLEGVILRTPPGSAFPFATAPLPPGTQLQLAIIRVTAPPFNAAPTATASPPSSTPAITTATPQAATPTTQASTTLQAAPPAASSPGIVASTAALAPSSPPAAQASTTASSIPAAPSSSSINPPNNAATSAYTAYARAPGAAAAYTPTPPAIPPVTAGGATPARAVALPAGPVTATVVSIDAAGEPLLATPFGLLKMNASAGFPIGSTITLNVSAPASPATASNTGAALSTIADLAKGWPALQQLLSTLGEGSQDPLLSFLRMSMPHALPAQPGANPAQSFNPQSLGSGLMFFIAALQGGDFKNWLGAKAVQTLETAGKGELIKRAEGEFMQLRELYTNPQPQQWQALLLPMLMEGEVKPLRLFIKRDKDKKDDKGRPIAGSDTRFVIEMDMSQLGEIQMDGLVKKRESATQFDLIIRSHAPLSDDARRDILTIYQATGEVTGYIGQLLFQESAAFPVQPMEEILSSGHRQVTA